jgi:hypothetical protein
VWTLGVFETRTGAPQFVLPVGTGTWSTRLTGKGTGEHTVPLFGTGIPQSLIREISKGNKYTLAQMWDGVVVYAGVIQRRRFVESTGMLTLRSMELRAAYLNSRMLYGVPFYDPDGTVLSVSSKSHSGAVRAVFEVGLEPAPAWSLPIDLPADGSGSFSAEWKYSDRLKVEDHLAQIEADGCEVDFRPYLDGDGYLRWETRVQTAITSGSATDLAAKAPGGLVVDLELVTDYALESTGVLGFGPGGLTAPTAWAGNAGVDISVRDVWTSFADIPEARLQSAVDALFAQLETPTEQWAFGLHVWPNGPAFALPGRLLNLFVYGSPFIPDGKHEKRVIALSGDMGFMVTPEVQDA